MNETTVHSSHSCSYILYVVKDRVLFLVIVTREEDSPATVA
jgi:hypothetical protein